MMTNALKLGLLEELIQALRCLPGVGPKSASRMAYHLLQSKREQGATLAKALENALRNVKHCNLCHTLTERELCALCESTKRRDDVLCVVAMASDIQTIEMTGEFNGRYFVLKGLLSPLDGIGPNELALDKLIARAKEGTIKEIILALSPTSEGDATVHYISHALNDSLVVITRLAYGIPIGGELEYMDRNTVGRAFRARASINELV